MGDRADRDERRDAWLQSQGIETVRISAARVPADPDAIAEWVRSLALERRGMNRQA